MHDDVPSLRLARIRRPDAAAKIVPAKQVEELSAASKPSTARAWTAGWSRDAPKDAPLTARERSRPNYWGTESLGPEHSLLSTSDSVGRRQMTALTEHSFSSTSSISSFLSTTRRNVPTSHQPPLRAPDTYLPLKVWSHRLGKFHKPKNPRAYPFEFGQERTSVVKTPDFTLPRWPPKPTSTIWRQSLPGNGTGLKQEFSGAWHSVLTAPAAPRGPPAPGGAPLQFPRGHIKEKMSEDRYKERPLRPFTHASFQTANSSFEEAMQHMDKCEYKQAEAKFKECIETDPNHIAALSYYGKVQLDVRSHHTLAQDLFIRALALEPANPVALGGLALLHANIFKDNNYAEKLFKQALEIDSTDSTNLANYSLFLRDVRDDSQKARYYMQQALFHDPTRPWLRNNAYKF